jgi:hypothetical protein
MGKDAVRSAKLNCGETEEGKNCNGLVKDSDYRRKVENSYGACKMTTKELVNTDVADGGVTLWGRWGGGLRGTRRRALRATKSVGKGNQHSIPILYDEPLLIMNVSWQVRIKHQNFMNLTCVQTIALKFAKTTTPCH